MIIRTATLADLPQIFEIGAKCYPAEEALTQEEYRGRLLVYPHHCIFRPSESKETVGVSPPSREKQVQVHGRESTGVLFGKKWQRNASQSAPPRVIYSDWNPFLLRMESSPSMRIL